MPWKLIPPRKGRSPYFYVRGTYCGIKIDRSTGACERGAAKRIFDTWCKQAERGEFSKPEGDRREPTFSDAAIAYMSAGGPRQYLVPIIQAWGDKPLDRIDQIAIDTLASQLYPNAPASTRNRQVYTPVSAILKRAGIERKVKRPKGWRGTKRTFWLRPEQAFAVFQAASGLDPEFGIMCITLNYTGMRLDECLSEMVCERVELGRALAYIGDTKTGEPRAVHLPPVVVTAMANHPRGLDRTGKVFRFHDGGRLRDMLREACKRAGVALPRRTAFHVFRHNYGTWMRVYGRLDGLGLLRTGVWEAMESVDRYSHSEAGEEARAADLLPTPECAPDVETQKRSA